MKVRFAVARQDLALALDKTSKALSSAPTESILKNFLIETVANGVWVSASDSTVTASTFVGAQVMDHGKMLFPSAWGRDLVRKAVGDYLAIGLTDEDSASIACGKARWNMRTRNPETYPATGVDGYSAETHEVDAFDFLQAIKSVRKAMAAHQTAFAQVVVRDGKVRAADGVWFQEAPLVGSNLDFAIPGVAVDDVLSFLGHARGPVSVSLTEGGVVVFRSDGDVLSFRLPAQNAPDFSKAFTAPLMINQDDLTISRLALYTAIGRVALASDVETQAITLALSAATVDSVVVSAKSRDGSWADEPVSCSWVGDTRKVLLHKDYILNALSSFRSKEVTLRLGPDSPSNPSQVLIQAWGSSAVLNQLRSDLI